MRTRKGNGQRNAIADSTAMRTPRARVFRTAIGSLRNTARLRSDGPVAVIESSRHTRGVKARGHTSAIAESSTAWTSRERGRRSRHGSRRITARHRNETVRVAIGNRPHTGARPGNNLVPTYILAEAHPRSRARPRPPREGIQAPKCGSRSVSGEWKRAFRRRSRETWRRTVRQRRSAGLTQAEFSRPICRPRPPGRLLPGRSLRVRRRC